MGRRELAESPSRNRARPRTRSAALKESKRKGHPTLAICNVVGSSIAREADGGVYLHAGQEIGVASTKAFTSQVTVLAMLALYFGRLRHMSAAQGDRLVKELRSLPDLVRQALECRPAVQRVADRFAHVHNMLYLGRYYLYPVAMEGALKLKEISYIHADGYPAAEMKHGPIALVDQDTPSVFLVPRGIVFDKVMSNLEEIRAPGRPRHHHRRRRRRTSGLPLRRSHPHPRRAGAPATNPGRDPAPVAGLRNRHSPRLRCGQAKKPGQERDGGVKSAPSLAAGIPVRAINSAGRCLRRGPGLLHKFGPPSRCSRFPRVSVPWLSVFVFHPGFFFRVQSRDFR